ncbi:MAG: putative metallo-hydrolase YycJ [Candidatus Anoxychlamydiales bacterium]|nr:putative metallo-hydrolase YycJ [Candidatus Anoxychlamydiales bacterium]
MIGYCPLASGSKGNSIYFGSKEAKILIDAGLSYLQLNSRLNEIGVKLEDIDAILITHEHSDHIAGLKVISEKENIPIFTNSDTAKSIYNNLHVLPKFKIFTTSEEFEYKDLKIMPFSVPHDTLDPVGFIIKNQNLKFGFCTDLGFISSLVRESLKGLDYLYIESNHHIPYVHASNRSFIYKQRVLSRLGHLSNVDSLKLLGDIIHPNLKHIHIAHISGECNSKELILDMFTKLLDEKQSKTKLTLAHQDKISDKITF